MVLDLFIIKFPCIIFYLKVEIEYDAWKFYDEKVQYHFAGLHHTRLVSPIRIARFRHQYSLVGIKTGDVNFSWRPGEVASGRSGKKISSFSSEADLLSIQVPQVHSTFSLSLQGKFSPADVLEVYTNLGTEVAHRVISGESSDELVVLATQDLSGQILHVRLAGDSRLNQRGSIYMGDFNTGMLSSDWILEREEGDNMLSSLVASPNPFDQQFTISGSYDQPDVLEVSMYTTSGQLVKSQSIQLSEGYNTSKVDASNLLPGIYLVELKSKNSSVIQKMIKQ